MADRARTTPRDLPYKKNRVTLLARIINDKRQMTNFDTILLKGITAMNIILAFLAGYFFHAWHFDSKFRKAIIYFLRFDFLAIFKPNTKQDYLIRYHPDFRKPPKGHQRIWPKPKHGGGPVETAIDKAARPLLEAGKSPPEVWDILAPDFYPPIVRQEIDTISGARKAALRRWRRKKIYKNSTR